MNYIHVCFNFISGLIRGVSINNMEDNTECQIIDKKNNEDQQKKKKIIGTTDKRNFK